MALALALDMRFTKRRNDEMRSTLVYSGKCCSGPLLGARRHVHFGRVIILRHASEINFRPDKHAAIINSPRLLSELNNVRI